MTFRRALRRFAALAAASGIALQALWPLLAQARPSAVVSVPVCSAAGAHRPIDLPVGGGKTVQRAEHCKLCMPGGDKPVVSNPYPVLRASRQPADVFPREEPNFVESSAAVSARPRAPPASL